MGADKSYRTSVAKPEERDDFEDLRVDDRKILIWILKQ
jgi:hypothetical protein